MHFHYDSVIVDIDGTLTIGERLARNEHYGQHSDCPACQTNLCLRGCGRNLGPYEECSCDLEPTDAYVTQSRIRWDEFYKAASADKPQTKALDFVTTLHENIRNFYYLTGRPSAQGSVNVRQLTVDWLIQHGFPFVGEDRLLMRPVDSYGKSSEVKREILVPLLPQLGKHVLAIDDEDNNLKMFHELGFTTMKSPYCWERISLV